MTESRPTVARAAGDLLGDDSRPVGDNGFDTLLGHQIAHFQIIEKLGGGWAESTRR
jgi:hypothetical protein